MTIRVYICEDHTIVRGGLVRIVGEPDDVELVGTAACAADLQRDARKLEWDVLLLDISLPDGNGVELLKDMKQRFPDRPVLILSMHSEKQYAARCIRAGASGYLTKGAAEATLIDAIRRVAAGKVYVSDAVGEKLVRMLQGRDVDEPHDALSNREFDVFARIAQGQSISDIAAGLKISPKTVSTHRKNILDKLGLNSNADLTLYAVRHGLMDQP